VAERLFKKVGFDIGSAEAKRVIAILGLMTHHFVSENPCLDVKEDSLPRGRIARGGRVSTYRSYQDYSKFTFYPGGKNNASADMGY